MCWAVGDGAEYALSVTSAPTSRNATMVTPRTGDVGPDTSSEMTPYNCNARCGAGATSALLSGVGPLHSLQQLEAERALARELLEQRTLSRDGAAGPLPSELPPRAPGDLHLLLPGQDGVLLRLGRRLRAGLCPILDLNLDETCFTHHLLPLDQQVRSQSEPLHEHLAGGLTHVRAPRQL